MGAFMIGHVSMLEIPLQKLIDPGPIGSPSVGSMSDYSLGSVAEKPGSCIYYIYILLIIQLYYIYTINTHNVYNIYISNIHHTSNI